MVDQLLCEAAAAVATVSEREEQDGEASKGDPAAALGQGGEPDLGTVKQIREELHALISRCMVDTQLAEAAAQNYCDMVRQSGTAFSLLCGGHGGGGERRAEG